MDYEILTGYYGDGQIHLWDGMGRSYKMYTGGSTQRSTAKKEGWLYRFDGINAPIKIGHWKEKTLKQTI